MGDWKISIKWDRETNRIAVPRQRWDGTEYWALVLDDEGNVGHSEIDVTGWTDASHTWVGWEGEVPPPYPPASVGN